MHAQEFDVIGFDPIRVMFPVVIVRTVCAGIESLRCTYRGLDMREIDIREDLTVEFVFTVQLRLQVRGEVLRDLSEIHLGEKEKRRGVCRKLLLLLLMLLLL